MRESDQCAASKVQAALITKMESIPGMHCIPSERARGNGGVGAVFGNGPQARRRIVDDGHARTRAKGKEVTQPRTRLARTDSEGLGGGPEQVRRPWMLGSVRLDGT